MMSLKSRRELAFAVAPRYRVARKCQKSTILDEFVEATGYYRKYAISVLESAVIWSAPISHPAAAWSRQRKYGLSIEQPFLDLWGKSGCLCPKRLMPFLAELIDALERFDEISLCPGVKDKLLDMSVSTAERMLGSLRACYWHTVLMYISHQQMKNATLR